MRHLASALAVSILTACTPASAPPPPSAPHATAPDHASRALAALVPVVQVKAEPDHRYGTIIHGKGRSLRFGHPGWNDGFHSEVLYFPELRQGAAVMVNGHAGRPMVREILYALAAEYGWPDFTADTLVPFAIDSKTRDALVATYEGDADGIIIDGRVRAEGEQLVFESKKLGVRSDVIFVSAKSFVVRDSGDELSFTLRADGSADALHFGDIALVRK